MKTITKLLKIMLRLWFSILTLSVVCIQLTMATETPSTLELTETPEALPTPAKLLTIDNNLKLLLETSTLKELRYDNEESVLKQTPTIASSPATTLEGEIFTPTVQEHSTTTTSFSTIASSNAPATITNQAKHLVTSQTLAKELEDKEKSVKNQEFPTKQYLNNDKSETEEKENIIKQVTQTIESVIETQHQQQLEQQEITTDVALQKETDMHIQSTGNARKTEIDIEPAATIAATKQQLTTTNEAMLTTTPTPCTNTPLLTTTMIYDASLLPQATEHGGDYIKQTETDVKGDDIKHHTVTTTAATTDITPTAKISTLTENNKQIDAITLTSVNDKQAMEDFKPIIQDANEKLIKERTIFSPQPLINNEEWKQNLMPNEVDYEDKLIPLSSKTKTYEHNINWSPYLHPATPVTDFTGKLLQEQDGVITEIEQKFRLNEFAGDGEAKPTKNPLEQGKAKEKLLTTSAATNKELLIKSFSVNHEILNKSPRLGAPSSMQFIERRVKKSFDFPMHRVASDALHLPQHFDFANTKFNSNNNDPLTQAAKTQDGSLLQVGQTLDGNAALRPQPEFSTTKFYNSKELYNEMLLHKTKQQQNNLQTQKISNKQNLEIEELNNKPPSLSLNSFAVLHSPKIAKLEELHELKEPQQKSLSIKQVTVKATKHKEISKPYSSDSSSYSSTTSTTTPNKNPSTSSTTTTTHQTTTPSTTSTTEIPLATVLKTKKFQKELKRAKLLIKTMMPLQNSTTLALLNNNNELKTQQTEASTSTVSDTPQLQMELAVTSTTNKPNSLKQQHSAMEILNHTPTPNSLKSSFATSTSSSTPQSFVAASISSSTSTNPPKSSIKPIVRPRILSRLQEKINSLECELQNLPQDSHLWRGNETHELLLPIMICKPNWTPKTWFANNRWILLNSENCSESDNTPENCKTDKDCTAMMVSWEGEAEIQSGDILIVEINDALLTPKDINLTTSAHNTQVYQVTRSGHEHCDVTEGILLDITPLIVDGRKLVTLYDKDLTEGVNLLIVVSELWGSQCVRLKVTTKTENCGENADCSGKGICYSNYDMEEYECQCCSGFAGPHCEEIDACTPSPCTNNGICVDLSQGHEGNSYQCLCPYGYTGKNCQYELDPCNPAECMNGGSCVGNSTHFRCECTPGYAGPLCQHSLNECESSPCIHGICVDQEDGFRCFCQPGFAGELCNFEYNECESNPCQNAGECIDHIGSYECHCTKGYTGNRCQIKVDFCANKPCPEGRRCIDHGNDYSCECLGGRNGPDCNEMQRTQCNVNPCTHGGTCWSSGDSFYCACRPGYTGTMCEDEFVVETVVSSSEFMVDDTSARNFNDKSFGSSVVLKSPIELHNAYTAAIVLALVIFFVALYLTICHCKVNQTYRKFSTRTYGFLPILGFRLRTKQATSKISRHWLSGKGLGGVGNVLRSSGGGGGGEATSSSTSSTHKNNVGHLPTANASSNATLQQQQHTHVGQLNERPFQRHLAMNLENDMYYTVDFSENSQHSPLIQ